MDFAELIADCCRCALRLTPVQGLVVKVAEGAAKKVGESAFTAIKNHFTLDPDEVGKAIQQSYVDALGILMLGSASPSFWENLKNQFVRSKQTKVMIQRTYEQFTLEFIKEQQLDEPAIEKLGNQMRAYCQALVKKKELILPAEQFSEPNPGLILNHNYSTHVSHFLLEHSLVHIAIDEPARSFFVYKDLLGRLVLYFFREQMKSNERVQKTIAALQQEKIIANTESLKFSQDQLRTELHQGLHYLAHQLQQQQTALQTAQQTGQDVQGLQLQIQGLQQQIDYQNEQLEALPKLVAMAESWQEVPGQIEGLRSLMAYQFEELFAELEHLGVMSEQILEKTQKTATTVEKTATTVDDIHEIVRRLEAEKSALRSLEKLMETLGMDVRIHARDAFFPHTEGSRKLIQNAAQELQTKSPPDPKDTLRVGCALASIGELEQARVLFLHLAENDPAEDNQTAYYNLFHIHLREGRSEEAIQALKRSKQSILFDITNFEPLKILGSSALGCSFLCKNKAYGAEVVLKTFWEPVSDKMETIISDLRDLDQEFIPRPLENRTREKGKQAYVAYKYIPNVVDVERYLQDQAGALELVEALDLGIAVTNLLKQAHTARLPHLAMVPRDLLIEKNTKEKRVYLTELGISQFSRPLEGLSLQSPQNLSTPFGRQLSNDLLYRAPEQKGQFSAPIGPRCDIYAVGAILYRLITNRVPSPINTSFLPEHAQLRELITRCVATNPDERPASAEELLLLLQEIRATAILDDYGLPQAPILRLGSSSVETAPLPQPGEVRALDALPNARLVWIPPGRFVMGAGGTETTTQVTITHGFWMAQMPVTQEQYRAVMGRLNDAEKGSRYPITEVTWHEAIAFCNRLSRKLGLPELFDVEEDGKHTRARLRDDDSANEGQALFGKSGVRLPTEAEWEYACRAGSQALRYGDFDSIAWFEQNAEKQLHAVAGKTPNAWGLYDILGNVWEWCLDSADEEEDEPTKRTGAAMTDPLCLSTSDERLRRGGSYRSPEKYISAAYRGARRGNRREPEIGFRFVVIAG